MENDNLSDNDLIYLGEEHIELDDSIHAGIDELVVDQDQLCDDEQSENDVLNDDFDEGSSCYQAENKDDRDLSGGKVEGLMVVDEWDDEEMDSDDDREEYLDKEKDAMNPEDIEKAMLSMPTVKVLMDDVGHLKQNRKVVLYPVTLGEFNTPQIQDVLMWSSLEEAKFDFARSHKDSKVLVGALVLHFTTNGSANKAMDVLKSWKNDLEMKAENNTNKIVEDFISDSRGKKRWTDNVAILKNLADDVKVESVKELFPQAEEVILHLDSSKFKETISSTNKDVSSTGSGSLTSSSAPTPRGYAYLIFPSDEIANAEVSESATKRLELSGHRLLLLNYKNPVNTVPRAYLRLRERKVIMRHLDKCLKMLEKANVDSSVKLPEQIGERIDLCKSLIDKDNKCRREMELPEPSLEELRRMSGLPTLDTTACHKILMRFGIVKEKKKRTPSPQNDRRRERGNIMTKSTWGTFRRASPSRGGRRSPFISHRRMPMGSDNYRRSRNMNNMNNRAMPSSLLGGPSNINPLALMMQQNLGMLSGSGVLNPNLLVQPNMNLLGGGGGGAGLLGSQSLPCVGGALDNGKSKMLRLDETGNYHPANEVRHPSYDDRPRRGGNSSFSRDNLRRKRSGSPLSRSRQDFDLMGTKRSGIEDNISSPVNLLLNLSQILSHNMEPRHHNMERGKRLSYDRDYRGNQR